MPKLKSLLIVLTRLCGSWWGAMSGAISIPFALVGFLCPGISAKTFFFGLSFVGLFACAASSIWHNHRLRLEKEVALGEQKDRHTREIGQVNQQLKIAQGEIQSLKREIENFHDEHLPLEIGEAQYISDGLENWEILLPIANCSKNSSATGVMLEFLNIHPLPPLNNGATIPFPIPRFAKEEADVIHPESQLLFTVLKLTHDSFPWSNFEIEFSKPFPKRETGFTPHNSFKPEAVTKDEQQREILPALQCYHFTIGVSADGRQQIKENFNLSFTITDKYFYDPSFSRSQMDPKPEPGIGRTT